MAEINIDKIGGSGGTPLPLGNLKVDNPLSNSLQIVKDTSGTASALLISTTDVTNYGGGAITSNTAFGSDALIGNTTGVGETAFGYRALQSNDTGVNNTATGVNSLRLNSSGSNNTALGSNSLSSNISGISNTGVGSNALTSNTTGERNVALGISSLEGLVSGNYNTAIGSNALQVTTGSNNTAIGYNTGQGITTGSNNTILGANVTGLSSTLANNIIIADGSGNRRINVDSSGNVGIGTNAPFSLLTVAGQSSFYSVQSAGTGSDFFYSDINPDITAGANNQVVSLMRLRDRGRNNTGGFTGTKRLSLLLENAGGGEFPFQLFSETGQLRLGDINIANPSAQLEIRGAGTTFATTSLLVQNSAGTNALQVRDDLRVIVPSVFETGGANGFTFNSNTITTKINGFLALDRTSNRQFTIGDTSSTLNYLILQTSSSSNFADISFNTDHLAIKKEGNIGIGTTSPNASAKLQIDSTTKGFLPPRMTQAQILAIAAPATGLMAYNLDIGQVCVYDGVIWHKLNQSPM